MLFYTLPAFTPGDGAAFLAALARSRGLVKARGVIDHVAAARLVLRDWGTGKIPRYAQLPSATEEAAKKDGVDGKEDADEELLEVAPLRKEMRKGRGIVRLKPREVETRKVKLDVKWDEEKDGSEEGPGLKGVADEDEDDDEDVDEIDEDDEDDTDEEEDAEAGFYEETDEEVEEDMVDLPPLPKGKRKRSDNPPPARSASNKKVAFAPLPKSTRLARAQPPSDSKSKKPQRGGKKFTGKSKRR